jgi:3-hydroxyisobutyrate dehydrogenase-like beta-hydroxyacid dehydrogenase
VIGFVGLGVMGNRMARRLLAAGYTLVVYDPRAEAVAELVALGATACASAREVADRAETVLVSLPTPQIVRDVACGEGGLAGGSAIRTYVDLSTTGSVIAEEVAAALAARGVRVVDAPVSGGAAGAEHGTLTVMVAAEADAAADVRPLLEAIGKNVFVVGERPGQGQVAKVVNNLLSAAAIALTGEAVALGVKAGLDARTLLEVIGVSSGSNTAATDKFPNQVVTRRFDQGFRLELMAKDVRLCLAEARRLAVPMLVGSTVEQLWSLAEHELEDGADCTEIAKLLEQWAGVSIGEAAS